MIKQYILPKLQIKSKRYLYLKLSPNTDRISAVYDLYVKFHQENTLVNIKTEFITIWQISFTSHTSLLILLWDYNFYIFQNCPTFNTSTLIFELLDAGNQVFKCSLLITWLVVGCINSS